MNILAIETTGAEASVAVINEKGEVFMEASDQKLNHLQNLMPIVDILLKKRGLVIGDINCIAVSEGPGSFTGIRIGVASARALAQALGLDTIGVPTLKSFLYNIPDYTGIICPIFDARRNQVYGGAYRWTGTGKNDGNKPGMGSCSEQYEEVVPGAAYNLADLLEKLKTAAGDRIKTSGLPSEVTFFGDGIISYKQQILNVLNVSPKNDAEASLKRTEEGKFSTVENFPRRRYSNISVLFADDDIRLQKASSVAKLALEIWHEGGLKSFYDLKPVYMRKAEAERKLEGQDQ